MPDHRARHLAALLLLLLLLSLPPLTTASARAAREIGGEELSLRLRLIPFASGFDNPVAVRHAGDERLFVVEQPGAIRIVRPDGTVERDPFLDIRERVGDSGYEQGLLGLAFHPNYADNGFFYLNYTDNSGDTIIARFEVGEDPDDADEASEQVLLRVEQPFSNHNGGDLAFGPDGYLYIALGDGGDGGDPQENGQSLATLLGKLLRIDVDSGGLYAVPPDNPFAGEDGAGPCGLEEAEVCSEIWAYGLRNPWRFSFDRETGDLYIGDVGQGSWEEIDFQPAASEGGENYGWDTMEGPACFEPRNGCDQTGLTLPIWYYPRSEGITVTGGYVYRGSHDPLMQGHYIFADFGFGTVWAIRESNGEWLKSGEFDSGESLSTFGEDVQGELYVAGFGGGGVVYRVVNQSPRIYLPLVR